MKISLATWKV